MFLVLTLVSKQEVSASKLASVVSISGATLLSLYSIWLFKMVNSDMSKEIHGSESL